MLTGSKELGRSESDASIPLGNPLLLPTVVQQDPNRRQQPRKIHPRLAFGTGQQQVDHTRKLVSILPPSQRLQERREADSLGVDALGVFQMYA